MKAKKWGSLLVDPRLPLYVPWFWFKRLRMKRTDFSSIPKMYGVVTCDFEHDGGSCGNGGGFSEPELKKFLKKFTSGLNRLKAKATFYIQGDLAGPFATEFKALKKEGHEIGLHGLHHELWGEAWFFNETPLSLEQMERALKTCKKEFEKAGLPAPTNFRAPNMVLDPKAYDVLARQGFTLDSSSPSYHGTPPVPYKKSSLNVIPVTADPRPHFRKIKGVIPSAMFKVFNVFNLLEMSDRELVNAVKRVVQVQKNRNVPPHLVFLVHPWEFKKMENFPYCHRENHKKIVSKLEKLEKIFPMEWITLHDLNQRLHDDVGSLS